MTGSVPPSDAPCSTLWETQRRFWSERRPRAYLIRLVVIDFTMFALASTIPKWDLHPTAACQQRQWGKSGIYRQQARDIHVTSLPKMCGGPGDIDEIRLCSLAWVNRLTPFGTAGGAGCVVVKLETTCGV